MKIKDREVRKQLMEQAQDSKLRTTKVLQVLRDNLNSNLSNATIASLNDCAFKALRKGGV